MDSSDLLSLWFPSTGHSCTSIMSVPPTLLSNAFQSTYFSILSNIMGGINWQFDVLVRCFSFLITCQSKKEWRKEHRLKAGVVWPDYINNEDSIKERLQRNSETWIWSELLGSRIRGVLGKGNKLTKG